MKKIICIEDKEYSKLDLLRKIDNYQTAEKFIDDAQKKGLLVLADNKNSIYKFKMVGLSIINDFLIYILPKHLNEDYGKCNFIIKLLRNYGSREKLDTEESEFLGHEGENRTNILGVIDYILRDYIENGLYINKEISLDTNNLSEIDWNKTLEYNQVMFNRDKQPLYTGLISYKSSLNLNSIITNIHKYIINKCWKKLNILDLKDIFEYNIEEFDIVDLGYDDEIIIDLLSKELDIQFEDRKVELLKAMINFIINIVDAEDDNEIITFGTKYFEKIWERVNSYVLRNQYHLYESYIPKPNWKSIYSEKDNRKSKFIPDTIVENDELKILFILDSKYYNIKFDKHGKLIGKPPGVEDIVKQLAYESTFKEKIPNDYNIFNGFLFPTYKETSITGKVELPLFGTSGHVNIIHINSDEVFEMYINNIKYDDSFWIRLGIKKSITQSNLKKGSIL
jgi:hypothetical protein